MLSTKLKVSGVDVFSAGEIFEDEQAKSIKEFNEWEWYLQKSNDSKWENFWCGIIRGYKGKK